MDRRRFLVVAGSLAAGVAALGLGGKLALSQAARAESHPASTGDAHARTDDNAARGGGVAQDSWLMVIDLSKCDGCGKCTKACQTNMHSPQSQEWLRVYKVKDEHGGEFFLPRPCMNCRNAPCLKVCPVGATFETPDGVIMVDQERCIGCRYCLAACPYNARSFTWVTPSYTVEEVKHKYRVEEPWPLPRGVAAKCVFCAHLARDGKLPYCATGCPMGAIYFANEREDAMTNSLGETLPLRGTLSARGAFRWNEEAGTDPRVYYLPLGQGMSGAEATDGA